MKSIMHNKKDRTCYLCMMLHGDNSIKAVLQEHHVIYGNGKRKLSEKYGLKVYLCFFHHEYDGGKEAVHRNTEISEMLKQEAQRTFEKKYPELNFREIFGKNYIATDRQQFCEKADTTAGVEGYQKIDGLLGMDIDW